MTASHSRLVLPAHVSLSLQIAAGPLNTRDGECIIDAPHENAATHNFSVPPRNALLRQAQTQSSVRLYRCGAIELSATCKRQAQFQNCETRDVVTMVLRTQTRKIFIETTIQMSAMPNKPDATKKGRWEANGSTC
jgi:hypothetical protein